MSAPSQTIELPEMFAGHSFAPAPGSAPVEITVNVNDIWMTPDAIAADMVNHFKPSGRMLEPCKGDGAFLRAMPGCDWCEIREGRDFFGWREPVDWIISNPPYSVFTAFHDHAQSVAENIVWLIPVHKPFGSTQRVNALRQWGWIRHIRLYGRSRSYGLDVGFVCGAVHFQRGWNGDTGWSFAAVGEAQNDQAQAQSPGKAVERKK